MANEQLSSRNSPLNHRTSPIATGSKPLMCRQNSRHLDREPGPSHHPRQFMHTSAETTRWLRNSMDLYDLWNVQAKPATAHDVARRDSNQKRKRISAKRVDRRTDLPYRCAPFVRNEPRTPKSNGLTVTGGYPRMVGPIRAQAL